MNKEVKEYIGIIFWSFVFCLGYNIFIVPFGLYNSGLIGAAQIIRTLLSTYLNINVNFDLTGIINFLFNAPLLIVALKKFNKSFVYKTIVAVIVQTFAFSLVFEKSLVNDELVSLIVGAVISGFASAKVLTYKGSGGGNDIIGMLLTLKNSKITVGKYCFYFNCTLYVICALLFDVEVAIYSILQSFIYTFMVDRGHLENIDVSVMVFTRNKDVKEMIMKQFRRGVTTWSGKGAYTNVDTEVLVTIVSKYEVANLQRKIRQLDSEAFVITTNVEDVSGGYEKRLV